MALYNDYLDQNNLYSRPSEMMSDVNDYLRANRASLPMNQNSLGSMMSSSKFSDDIGGNGSGIPKHIQDLKDRRNEDDRKDPPPTDPPPTDPPPTGDNKLLEEFIGNLEVLSKEQRDKLLGFIGTTAGDKTAGVSPSEYAELYNISSEYADRFQGLPNLTSLLGDIQNVFLFKNQQRGFEQRAAQQAQIAQGGRFQGGMGFGRFGRGTGMSNALNRMQMQDRLKQRQAAVDEAVAGKYGNLLNMFSSRITSGINIAGGIVEENPYAEIDYGKEPQEGDTRYMNGINWIFIDGAWINEQQYLEEKRAEGD